MSSIENKILREVTNEIQANKPIAQKKISSWSGVRTKFDDEGNRQVVLPEMAKISEIAPSLTDPAIPEELQTFADVEGYEEGYEEEGRFPIEGNETNGIWENRDPSYKETKWCGTHILFSD